MDNGDARQCFAITTSSWAGQRPTIIASTRIPGEPMKHLLSAVLVGLVALSPMAAMAKKKHHDRHHHYHYDHDDHDHDDDDDHRHHRHDYRRGVVYVERRVYVDDYRHYDLAPPPRGHRWVRSEDGKYVLIAVATGVIADILLHH